jgi:hypothetical protein
VDPLQQRVAVSFAELLAADRVPETFPTCREMTNQVVAIPINMPRDPHHICRQVSVNDGLMMICCGAPAQVAIGGFRYTA